MEPALGSSPEQAISERVRQQYRRAPFPPVSLFPVESGPPRARIWMYSAAETYYHAFRRYRDTRGLRILDAGCGTGHGIVQIRHQAPGAEVHACDFSNRSLEIARDRIAALGGEPVTFHELNLLDLQGLPGDFDVIFCSGVVHHTADPVRALRQLKSKLKPDGVLYLMLYSEFGRRPTMLMQRAIKLLTRNPEDQQEGLRWGRQLFDGLPPANVIATWEREKWGGGHRMHEEAFIDMYVNANEKNYSIRGVFADLAQAGLRFVRFSHPHEWELAKLMQVTPELIERFRSLPELDRYDLIEHLFPVYDQYHFVCTHAEQSGSPPAWLADGSLAGREDSLTALRSPFAAIQPGVAVGEGFVCWKGYFDGLARLDALTSDLLNHCDGKRSVREIAAGWERACGSVAQGRGVEVIRQLEANGLLYLIERNS